VFDLTRYWETRLFEPPDLPSLPARDSINSLAYGSMFRIRYVSPSLLFHEPLGTIVIMQWKWFCVNEIFARFP